MKTALEQLKAVALADYDFVRYTTDGGRFIGFGYSRDDGHLHFVRQNKNAMLATRVTVAETMEAFGGQTWDFVKRESSKTAHARFISELQLYGQANPIKLTAPKH